MTGKGQNTSLANGIYSGMRYYIGIWFDSSLRCCGWTTPMVLCIFSPSINQLMTTEKSINPEAGITRNSQDLLEKDEHNIPPTPCYVYLGCRARISHRTVRHGINVGFCSSHHVTGWRCVQDAGLQRSSTAAAGTHFETGLGVLGWLEQKRRVCKNSNKNKD